MGQQEFLDILEKKKDWMLAVEIRKELGLAAGAVNRLIKILLKNVDIEAKLAIKVIKNKKRLKRSTINARAYRIKK